MNLCERILVVPDSETNYNLCAGGFGGFSFINENRLNDTEKKRNAANKNLKLATPALIKKIKNDENFRKIMSENISKGTKEFYKENGHSWTGRQHSEETKRKMSLSNKQQGINNSQYGTCWITNGINNKKIKENDLDNWIGQGYYKGRI